MSCKKDNDKKVIDEAPVALELEIKNLTTDEVDTILLKIIKPDALSERSEMYLLDEIVLKKNVSYEFTSRIIETITSDEYLFWDLVSPRAENYGLFCKFYPAIFEQGLSMDSLNGIADVEPLDKDAHDFPIGLRYKLTPTVSNSTAILNLILKKQEGVKDGSFLPGDLVAVYAVIANFEE